MHFDYGNGATGQSATFAVINGTAASRGCRPGELEPLVKRIIDQRRQRARFFPNHLFADPAWEILLALMLAEQQQRRLSVSQLCDRVDVPATTTLRWIASMTDEGLLVRRDDPTDGRRKYIEMSPNASDRMTDYCLGVDLPARLAA